MNTYLNIQPYDCNPEKYYRLLVQTVASVAGCDICIFTVTFDTNYKYSECKNILLYLDKLNNILSIKEFLIIVIILMLIFYYYLLMH